MDTNTNGFTTVQDSNTDDRDPGQAPDPPSRLRSRIMASSYQYKMLHDEEYMDMNGNNDLPMDEGPGQRSMNSVTWLKLVLLLLGVLCVALFVALLVVLMSDTEALGGTAGRTTEALPCTSPSCITSSAYILASMNLSAQPCQDMYNFACGGWIAKAQVPLGSSKWSQFSQLATENNNIVRKIVESDSIAFKGANSTALQKLKTYYASCMDYQAIEKQGTGEMLEAMAKQGSWTVTPVDPLLPWDDTNWNLQNSLGIMHRLMRSSFFGFGITPDPKNNAETIIEFTQSGLTLSHEGEYLDENTSEKFKTAYMEFATQVGVLLGGDKDTVAAKMEEVYALEKRLAGIFVPRENLTDPLEIYNKMTVGDFNALIGGSVDIRDYLADSFVTRQFTQDTEVNVLTPAYFEKLGPIIQNTSSEVLANYMMWNFVSSMTGYLPEDFALAALVLEKAERGTSHLSERWQRCLAKANAALGFASSALFVDEHFTPASKQRVTTIIQEIRAAFVDNLGTLTWMDQVTKDKLVVKANAMTEMVGYPEWLLDRERLDKYYEKMTIQDGRVLANKLASVNFHLERELAKYGKAPDKMEWGMKPYEVNAYYSPEQNKIVVPAGILQPPFYGAEFPDSLVYGSIGFVLGHELSHGFDNSGRRYDGNGNMAEMWTPETSKAFEKETQCMVDQYSRYTVYGHHLNGETTLGENIADNAGLKLAYNALHSAPRTRVDLPGLTVDYDQLFFMGFSQLWCAVVKPEFAVQSITTDPHSIGSKRVLGVLQNSDDFTNLYKCKEGSVYNPPDTCKLW